MRRNPTAPNNGSNKASATESDPPETATITSPAAPGAGPALPFEAQVRSYLATREGQASVAVFDAKTGQTHSYAAGTRFVTASVVKVSILGTLLAAAPILASI